MPDAIVVTEGGSDNDNGLLVSQVAITAAESRLRDDISASEERQAESVEATESRIESQAVTLDILGSVVGNIASRVDALANEVAQWPSQFQSMMESMRVSTSETQTQSGETEVTTVTFEPMAESPSANAEPKRKLSLRERMGKRRQ